jgi:hypothetical protein
VSLVAGASGGMAGAAASSGVAAYAYGQPFFSRSTALNIAVGAVAGGGGGLVAAGAHLSWFTPKGGLGVNPTPVSNPNEIGVFPQPGNVEGFPVNAGDGALRGNVRILMPSDPVTASMKNQWQNLGAAGRATFERRLTTVIDNGTAHAVDAVATHGLARQSIVEWAPTGGGAAINRPLSTQALATFLRGQGYGDGLLGSNRPIKLVVCFGGMGGRFSLAQSLANELGVSVYAQRWRVNPNPLRNAQWIRFDPR